jgi:FixJ family two-component response regulator
MNSPVTTQETVFVVDDDEAVRDSLRWLLEANGYRVQCFNSAEEFLEAYQPAQAGQIACLILDVRMSGMSGLELQERLIADNASLPIIFVTGHGDVPMAVSTMKKGAMDFIEKPFDEAELRKLVERMLEKARSESTNVQQQRAAAERLGKLTAREHQVLERIIAGRLNKQIADDLGISIKTVEAHRANIMEKLNVNTVADLLRLALSNKPQQQQQ